MTRIAQYSIRTRLTRWYIGVMTALLIVFAAIVFVFQYSTLKRQIIHDEVQDAATVEGLLSIDASGQMQLRHDYFSRPQSHLLIDRLMEVRDLNSKVVFRSDTLDGQALGGNITPREGDGSFNDRIVRLPDGAHVLVISHIHGINGHDYVIRIGYSLAPLRTRMWQFLGLLIAALLVMTALTTLTGSAVARRILSPLQSMADRAEGISARNLEDRLLIANEHDELGALAVSFNRLLDRLEQAFTQLQRFTADAAHELRTPLASLRAIGEVTLSEPRCEAEYRDALSSILEETNRLNETIESLLLLARAEAIHAAGVETVSITPLLEEVIAILLVLAEERSIRFRVDDGTGGNVTVTAERALLRVALMNVLHNAIKFSPDAGVIRCSLTFAGAEADFIRIRIEDEGPGISPAEAHQLFDRFRTGSHRDAPIGTGLGLSIARLVLERAGGAIGFDSSVRTGASCVLELPTATAQTNKGPRSL